MVEHKPAHPFPFQELKYTLDIDRMTTQDKLTWLANDSRQLEERYLRPGKPAHPAEAKLLFLFGGDKRDVTEALDFDQNPIHTRKLSRPRPKAAEIPEALTKISEWFDRVDRTPDGSPPPSMAEQLGEVVDVVYNITHLVALDTPFRNDYINYITLLANSCGLTLDQLLTATIYKYNFRLGQGKSQKDLQTETAIIQSLMDRKNPDGSPFIPSPTSEQLHRTFHTLSEIQNLLHSRYRQLEQMHKWQKAATPVKRSPTLA